MPDSLLAGYRFFMPISGTPARHASPAPGSAAWRTQAGKWREDSAPETPKAALRLDSGAGEGRCLCVCVCVCVCVARIGPDWLPPGRKDAAPFYPSCSLFFPRTPRTALEFQPEGGKMQGGRWGSEDRGQKTEDSPVSGRFAPELTTGGLHPPYCGAEAPRSQENRHDANDAT
jgi:hypothetical protein